MLTAPSPHQSALPHPADTSLFLPFCRCCCCPCWCGYVITRGHAGVIYFTVVVLHEWLPLSSYRAKAKVVFALTVPVVVRRELFIPFLISYVMMYLLLLLCLLPLLLLLSLLLS